MSERRRSLFVLLIVLGLIAGSLYVVSSKETKLGLDLQGGVQLIYEGKPTAQQPTVTSEALQRSLDIMRDRVDAFGVSEPELLQSGDNQIEVNLPGVEDAERAAAQVGSTAQLFFYDWEANILDEDCRTDADENANNRTAISGFYNAILAASKCDAQADGNNNAADAPRFYAFNKETKQPYNNGAPSESEEAATADLTEEQKANAEVIEVPEGILVVRDAKPNAEAPEPDRYWVIQDNPALSGTDIKNPEQNFDETRQPVVTFNFTDKGRTAFHDITREIAQRGVDNALPTDIPSNASQHFAIVLDDELISAPHINYQENPDGIDGSTGAQISGSFTIPEAQDLARILQIGALPIRLELVSRSQVSATLGAQALDEGLLAQRGRDLRARDQVELQRQGAGLEHLRQILRAGDREAAGDLRALGAVDPVRVLDVVDRRRRDELVVEHDREMLRACRPERVVASALGDRARDLLERFAPGVGELEPDVRRVAEPLVKVLLRIADVGAGQRRLVEHHPEPVGVGSIRAHLLIAHHQDAFGDLDHLRPRAPGNVEVLERRRSRLRWLAVVQRTPGGRIERVEPRPVSGAGVAVTLRIAPRGLLHRLEEPRGRLPLVRVSIGIGPAVLIEQHGFPVVEGQLRRRPDLLSRPLAVLDSRQTDLDLVPTGPQ